MSEVNVMAIAQRVLADLEARVAHIAGAKEGVVLLYEAIRSASEASAAASKGSESAGEASPGEPEHSTAE